MKNTLGLFLIICAGAINAQSWEWAHGAPGNGYDEGLGLCRDKSGNIYTTGYFGSSSVKFGQDTLFQNGVLSLFLAKYSSSGNALWAKTTKGIGSGEGYSVSTDAAKNVYVSGAFTPPYLVFETDTISTTGTAGSFALFLAKFDSLGNLLWVKSSVGTSYDLGIGVSADPFGNVYLTGSFASATMKLDTFTLTNTGSEDIFIAKFDSSGNVKWAKGVPGSNDDQAFAVASDNSGNAYITGFYSSSSVSFDSYTFTCSGSHDFFLAKYDSAGNVLWAHATGGIGLDGGYGVCVDKKNNAYVTGKFTSPYVTFGLDTLTAGDVFIVKYDSLGNEVWAKAGGGEGRSVAVDTYGNVYATAGFNVPYTIYEGDTLFAPNNSQDPMYVVKLDSLGTRKCITVLGTGGDDNIGIATDESGGVYIGGDFWLNQFVLGNDTLFPGAPNAENIFVAKFSCDEIQSINENYHSTPITVFPNPATNILNIECASRGVDLRIFDVLGNEVHRVCFSLSGHIDVSDLHPGVYFIAIRTNGHIITEKFVKE